MILAFGNKARHGKDTAGESVVDFYNNRRQRVQNWYGKPPSDAQFPEARIFKFADALYRVCREEYGMTEKDPALLQKIGDGRRNEFGLDYWIKQLDVSLKNFKGVKVVTDCRYTNEADYIKSIGGFTVNVSRVNIDGSPYISPDRDPNFISEVQLDEYSWDYYIKVRQGDVALTGEIAITIAEYIRSI